MQIVKPKGLTLEASCFLFMLLLENVNIVAQFFFYFFFVDFRPLMKLKGESA